MLTAQLPAKRLRAEWLRTKEQLLRRYGPALRSRGFDMSSPQTIDVHVPEDARMNPEALIIITQPDPPNRVGTQRMLRMLQQISQGVPQAIGELYAFLLAEGDDRAQALSELEVSMPEDCMVMADFGTRSDTHTTEQVSGEKMAQWLLCQKVLLLFGAKQEMIE